jgi:polysaccharide lyase-like protein
VAFRTPLSRLLVAFTVLAAVSCIGVPAAGARPHHGKGLAVAKRVAVRHTHLRARTKRLLRRSQTHRGVANAVSLTPKARASASGLLFDGSQIGDFDQIQAAPGAITEVSDPAGSGENSFKMTVDDRDVYPVTPTDNPRAQALSPALIHPGDEFWLSTKFMLPTDLPSIKGWMSLVSVYGAPFNGPGPWGIEVADNELRWERNGTYHWDIPWRMPLVKGQWVTVLLHERFAGDGFVEMWINGQQVDFAGGAGSRLSMQTMDSSNDGGANAAKIMQYREAGMFDTASVYFGPLKLGTTRASVGG